MFEWDVISNRDGSPLTDAQLIKAMAHENNSSFNRDPNVLREVIVATVEALGAGKITPEEMPVAPRTDPKLIRYSPSAQADGRRPYTMDGIAEFLGQVEKSAAGGTLPSGIYSAPPLPPGFGVEKWTASGLLPPGAYTVDALAKFLGEVDEKDNKATESFKATFGALELIAGNGLRDSDVAGLEVWKIDATSYDLEA